MQKTLSQNSIKELVFNNYTLLTSYADNKFNNLSRIGISTSDIVNDAIINTFDTTIDFACERDLIDFVKKSIVVQGYKEIELSKDKNFITQKNKSGDEYEVKASTKVNIKNVYELFEIAKFGVNDENKECIKCGSKRFYHLRNLDKCATCGTHLSVQAGTYFHNSKLSYLKTFLLIKSLVDYPKQTSTWLARYCETTQKTAYYKACIIKAAIKDTKDPSIESVLKRLLTTVQGDAKPLKIKRTPLKFTPKDVSAIMRLRGLGLSSCTELAKQYKTDGSTISKIANGKAYTKKRKFIPLYDRNKHIVNLINKVQQAS